MRYPLRHCTCLASVGQPSELLDWTPCGRTNTFIECPKGPSFRQIRQHVVQYTKGRQYQRHVVILALYAPETIYSIKHPQTQPWKTRPVPTTGLLLSLQNRGRCSRGLVQPLVMLDCLSHRTVKGRRILDQPVLLNLSNVPDKRLLPGLHDLMENDPISLTVEHEGAGMGVQHRGA